MNIKTRNKKKNASYWTDKETRFIYDIGMREGTTQEAFDGLPGRTQPAVLDKIYRMGFSYRNGVIRKQG